MTDYQKYINALRKCAKEHEGDRTFTGQIIVSNLCQDTANLLEELEQEPITKNYLGVSSELAKNSKKLEKDFDELDCISRAEVLKLMQDNWHTHNGDWAMQESMDDIRALPSVTPIRPKGHWIDHSDDGYVECPKCGSATNSRDARRW